VIGVEIRVVEKPTHRERPSPGGSRLRRAREDAGRTQLWVELEAGLGTGYLQRLESGRVIQPARATLDRILGALRAGYNVRQEIMQLFGYTVPTDPPDEETRRWARDLATPQIASFPFPAYALDCRHVMVAWNAPLERLLGVDARHPAFKALLERSILEVWFDASSILGRLVADPEPFLSALVVAFRYEMQRFQDEPWSREIIGTMRAIPLIERYWQATAGQPPVVSAARALMPLALSSHTGERLSFRLSSEPFVDDARFRIVYYFPDDVETMNAFKPSSTASGAVSKGAV
jgi:transcriptional regulator with XRE-family HTH domain